MSLLLAIAFATAGVSAVTQGADTGAATGFGQISAVVATTQGADGGNAVLQAFGPTAVSATTQGADTATSRGIPSPGPLDVAFSPVAGAQVETWVPVSETGIIWNLGG